MNGGLIKSKKGIKGQVQLFYKMQTLLLTFNHYTFTNSAQTLLSMLTPQDLESLLQAIQPQQHHDQLAHLIRTRIIVTRMHQVDRSIYFIHFDCIPKEEFERQRCNLIAGGTDRESLKLSLVEIGRIQRKGMELLGEQYCMVSEAISQPDLPLPPVRRDTFAPHCQTVYQVVLACQKLNYLQPDTKQLTQINGKHIVEYFFELLLLQVKLVGLYLSVIQDPFQHFAQITYRFMVYRNTVLALHNIHPFERLTSTMQLWKNALMKHYQRSNEVFLEIGGFKKSNMDCQYGRFTKQLLRDEGYLIDYAEGLIDLSINEDIVAFCGHSKQSFGQIYSHLENLIVLSIIRKRESLEIDSLESLHQHINEWINVGLKPCTIRKIIQELNMEGSIMKESRYCRQDDYIETCARIHGLMERSNIEISCN